MSLKRRGGWQEQARSFAGEENVAGVRLWFPSFLLNILWTGQCESSLSNAVFFPSARFCQVGSIVVRSTCGAASSSVPTSASSHTRQWKCVCVFRLLVCVLSENREKKSPGCCSYRQLFRAAEESAPAVGGEPAVADTWRYSKHVRSKHFSLRSCCDLNGVSSAAALLLCPGHAVSPQGAPSLPCPRSFLVISNKEL